MKRLFIFVSLLLAACAPTTTHLVNDTFLDHVVVQGPPQGKTHMRGTHVTEYFWRLDTSIDRKTHATSTVLHAEIRFQEDLHYFKKASDMNETKLRFIPLLRVGAYCHTASCRRKEIFDVALDENTLQNYENSEYVVRVYSKDDETAQFPFPGSYIKTQFDSVQNYLRMH